MQDQWNTLLIYTIVSRKDKGKRCNTCIDREAVFPSGQAMLVLFIPRWWSAYMDVFTSVGMYGPHIFMFWA